MPDLPKVSPDLMRAPARPKCDLDADKPAYSGWEMRAQGECKDAAIKVRDEHIAGLQRAIRVREKAVQEAVAAGAK